jgi:hypothetical protein
MNEYKIISHETGEVFAVLVIETEMSYYVKCIGVDPDTLPHNEKLERRLNNEMTDMYKSLGRATKIAALAEYKYIWYATNTKAKA